VINSSGKFSSANWISVDVTSLINGIGVYDLAVTTTSTSSMSFNSRDASSFQPQLVIQSTTNSTPTATPTATTLFTSTPTATNTSAPNNTPTLTLVPTDTPTEISPTAVFSDGFETGDLSSWTSSAGLLVQSTLVYSGNYAAQGNTTTGNTYAKKTLPTSYSDGYSRIYFNLASYSSQVNLLRYRTSANASIGYLFINTSGKLGLRNDVAAVTTTSTTTVGSGWHALEFHVIINGASSITEVWLDGVKINDLSITTNLGSNLIGGFQIGEVQSGRTYNVILDDVIFDTLPIGL